MKVGYGKKVAKKGLTGKAGKKGRRDKERLAREKKKETAATIEDAVKDVEKMMGAFCDFAGDAAKPLHDGCVL